MGCVSARIQPLPVGETASSHASLTAQGSVVPVAGPTRAEPPAVSVSGASTQNLPSGRSPYVPSSRAAPWEDKRPMIQADNGMTDTAASTPLRIRSPSSRLDRAESSSPVSVPSQPQFLWEHLQVLRLLGRGHFGKVFSVRHLPTGREYALKTIRAHLATQQNEIKALQEVSGHPNVTSLYKVFSSDEHTYLLMDVCHCNLFTTLVQRGHFSEALCIRIVREVIAGIAYIHSRNILHGDIKPENLLVKHPWNRLTDDELLHTDLNVKVADFGLSYIFPPGTDQKRKAGGGTKSYSAPEKLKGEIYGPPADMWAVGVITYIMLGGYHPFDEFGRGYSPVVGHRIINCQWRFIDDDWKHISSDARDFISKLLKQNPADRATAMQCAAHPWLNDGCQIEIKDYGAQTDLSWMPPMLHASGPPATPFSETRSLEPKLTPKPPDVPLAAPAAPAAPCVAETKAMEVSDSERKEAPPGTTASHSRANTSGSGEVSGSTNLAPLTAAFLKNFMSADATDTPFSPDGGVVAFADSRPVTPRTTPLRSRNLSIRKSSAIEMRRKAAENLRQSTQHK